MAKSGPADPLDCITIAGRQKSEKIITTLSNCRRESYTVGGTQPQPFFVEISGTFAQNRGPPWNNSQG